jgi:hypothetical protein
VELFLLVKVCGIGFYVVQTDVVGCFGSGRRIVPAAYEIVGVVIQRSVVEIENRRVFLGHAALASKWIDLAKIVHTKVILHEVLEVPGYCANC